MWPKVPVSSKVSEALGPFNSTPLLQPIVGAPR